MKIIIPKYNEYPVEETEKWAQAYYRRARAQVDWRKAEKIKDGLPIEKADHAEKMTFIFWRLFGPLPGHPAKEAPLEMLLEYLQPHISDWKKFKREFTHHMEKAFEAIHNSNYLPAMIQDRNNWLNQLLKESAKEVNIHLEFISHPDTAESYDSPRILEMRSRIWKYYTGKPLDLTKFVPLTNPIPGRPIQMEMHLDLSIAK
jgi:hypothetical protein